MKEHAPESFADALFVDRALRETPASRDAIKGYRFSSTCPARPCQAPTSTRRNAIPTCYSKNAKGLQDMMAITVATRSGPANCGLSRPHSAHRQVPFSNYPRLG